MIHRPHLPRHALPLVLLAMVLGACAPAATAPGARTPVVGIERIDSVALLADIAALAADSMEGRRAGSPGGAMARAYLTQRLRSLGFEPATQPFTFAARGGDSIQGTNLIVHIPGASGDNGVIVVTAHYDHVGVRDGEVFNGADDNASGAAALLSISARLRESPLQHGVLLVWLDAEEMGLRGARAFLADPPLSQDSMLVNVNMDMVSRSDAGELYVAGTHHHPQLLPIVERVAERAPVTLLTGHDVPGTGRDDWTNQSDHGVFHQAGIPFLYFGVEDHPDYHRPSDDVERTDRAFYVGAVETVLFALRELDRSL